jgi:hypothetical protein
MAEVCRHDVILARSINQLRRSVSCAHHLCVRINERSCSRWSTVSVTTCPQGQLFRMLPRPGVVQYIAAIRCISIGKAFIYDRSASEWMSATWCTCHVKLLVSFFACRMQITSAGGPANVKVSPLAASYYSREACTRVHVCYTL